jgi:hypothetical protein
MRRLAVADDFGSRLNEGPRVGCHTKPHHLHPVTVAVDGEERV